MVGHFCKSKFRLFLLETAVKRISFFVHFSMLYVVYYFREKPLFFASFVPLGYQLENFERYPFVINVGKTRKHEKINSIQLLKSWEHLVLTMQSLIKWPKSSHGKISNCFKDLCANISKAIYFKSPFYGCYLE